MLSCGFKEKKKCFKDTILKKINLTQPFYSLRVFLLSIFAHPRFMFCFQITSKEYKIRMWG